MTTQADSKSVWPAVILWMTLIILVIYVVLYPILASIAGSYGFEAVWGRTMATIYAPLLWLDANCPPAQQFFRAILRLYDEAMR